MGNAEYMGSPGSEFSKDALLHLHLLLFCTTNIHLASGKGENGLEQGHDCKANKLLGELNQLLAEAVAISAPKMSEETILTTIKGMEEYKKALMKEKRQSGCIGGEEVEAHLKPLIEMMKHMVKGAKGDKEALAKLKEEKSRLSALLPTILKQKDQKAGDYFFQGLGGLFQGGIQLARAMLSIAKAGLPVMIQIAELILNQIPQPQPQQF